MKTDTSSVILRFINWVLFVVGVLGLVLGVFVVHLTSMQEDRKRTQHAMVQTGEIEPVSAVVTGKRIEKTSSSSGAGSHRTSSTSERYRITLKIDGSEAVGRRVSRSDYDAIQKGDVYDAYLLDGQYFVPRVDAQTHDYVKWIIFFVCTVPMLGAIGLFLSRLTIALRAGSHAAPHQSNIA